MPPNKDHLKHVSPDNNQVWPREKTVMFVILSCISHHCKFGQGMVVGQFEERPTLLVDTKHSVKLDSAPLASIRSHGCEERPNCLPFWSWLHLMTTAEVSLSEKLTQRPPRETSGSRSANRFDFQKDWVLCRILDLHLQNKEYLVICDYHEDVTILDRESDPLSAAYYQIKTRTGENWTTKRLLSRSKGKDGQFLPSILGNLYSNYTNTLKHTKSLNFISNASYRFDLQDGKDSLSLLSIACRQLSAAEIMKIVSNLEKECGQKCLLPTEPPLFFEVTSLSVQDHSTHATGKVADFLNKYLPRKIHHAPTVYRALFDEVRRKTTREGLCSNFEELQRKKGIAKSGMDELLQRIASTEELADAWGEVSQRLVSEKVPPLTVRNIHSAWGQYQAERTNYANDVLQKLRSKVIEIVSKITASNPGVGFTELMDRTWELIQKETPTGTYSSEYVQAMALMEFYVS